MRGGAECDQPSAFEYHHAIHDEGGLVQVMQHDEYGQATTRQLDQALARIAELEARNAELAARLVQLERPGKTPGNFSRPATKGQRPDGPAYAAFRSVVSTAEANRRSVLDSLRSAFAAPPANQAVALPG